LWKCPGERIAQRRRRHPSKPELVVSRSLLPPGLRWPAAPSGPATECVSGGDPRQLFRGDDREDLAMKRMLMRLFRDEQGQDIVEYALLVGFVALAVVPAVNVMRTGIDAAYAWITGQLPGGGG
jgi:Flp pilus assembly pilin Flp